MYPEIGFSPVARALTITRPFVWSRGSPDWRLRYSRRSCSLFIAVICHTAAALAAPQRHVEISSRVGLFLSIPLTMVLAVVLNASPQTRPIAIMRG